MLPAIFSCNLFLSHVCTDSMPASAVPLALFYPSSSTLLPMQVPCYLLLFLYPLFYPCLYPNTRTRGRPPRAPWFCREWRVPLNRDVPIMPTLAHYRKKCKNLLLFTQFAWAFGYLGTFPAILYSFCYFAQLGILDSYVSCCSMC
jgi:hypothetical protein